MKYTLLTLIVFASTVSYGQSWEVGTNFGSRLCLNNFVGDEASRYNHLLNNDLVGETGVFAKYQMRKHWALACDINYFRITYTQSHFNDPWYFKPNVIEYFGTMVTSNIETNIALYYCFNSKTKSPNLLHKIKSSIGLSIGYINSQQKYKVLEFDTLTRSKETTTKYNNGYFLIGLHYNAQYSVSNHLSICFDLCFNKSTYIWENPYIPYSRPGYFEPLDSKTYIYSYPEAFLTYKLGIGYKF